jgi:hypothetical protein
MLGRRGDAEYRLSFVKRPLSGLGDREFAEFGVVDLDAVWAGGAEAPYRSGQPDDVEVAVAG